MPSTVFVSSTFVDLQSHRKATWEALQAFDVNVRGMEQFGARTETPLQTCIAEVEQSDIYVGIIGFRLGSIEPTSGKSYTQLEYERALALSKYILVYLIDEQNAKIPRRSIDVGESLERLDVFKKILRERHTIDTFVDEADLVTKLSRDLQRHALLRAEAPSHEDELHLALTRLRHFSILPKAVSGSEIRIELRLKSDLYPASQAICDAFNLDFGATAGAHVEIVAPRGSGLDDVPDLLIPAKLLLEHLPLSKGDNLTCYVKLHFAPNRVGEVRARHRDRIDYPDSPFNMAATVTGILGKPVVTQQADFQIAFEASRVIAVLRNASI
jgi:hypothetical protein